MTGPDGIDGASEDEPAEGMTITVTVPGVGTDEGTGSTGGGTGKEVGTTLAETVKSCS